MKFKNLPRMRNKIAFYCAIFILYFFFGIAFESYGAVVCICAVHLCASVVLLVLARGRTMFLRTFGLVVLSSALGLLWSNAARYIYYYPSQRFIEEYAGSEHELMLRVDKVDSFGDTYGNYNCSILACDGKKTESVFGVYPALRLSCFGGDFAEKGDIVSLTEVIMLPETETASGFEEEKYLRSKHIFMVCEYNDSLELLERGKASPIDKLRARLSENLTRFVGDDGGDEAAIARCMLLGEKSGVRKQIKEIFRAAGVSHVLSVSGLHLSILFMTVSLFFGLRKRSLRRRFVFAETVSCVLVLLYMCFADFTPSIMRAGFMLIFMNLYHVWLFYRRRLSDNHTTVPCIDGTVYGDGYVVHTGIFDSVASLFCAGALIVVVSPYSIFDVGMQLSFMSTLGILIAVSVFGVFNDRKMNPLLRGIIKSLLITFAAVSFTLPICIYNFRTLSTVSFITNLLITPVMTPLLALLLILALVSLLPWIGVVVGVCSFLGRICEILCGFCIGAAEYVGSFTFSVIPARESIVLVAVFIVYVVFTVMCLFLGQSKLRTVGYMTLMLLYFSYTGISFGGYLCEFSMTCVNFCTVGNRPYFCVAARDDRIFFDDVSMIASDNIIRKSLGEQHYDTDNVYVVLPRAYADLGSAMFNIGYLDKSEGVETVLVPSKELCDAAGVDGTAYGDFAAKISAGGFNVEYYGENFSVGGIDFSAKSDVRGVSFSFDDISVVFADDYDEYYASEVSEDMEACVYFCRFADETDNHGYKSEAELYLTSYVHGNVRGAKAIPTRKPKALR